MGRFFLILLLSVCIAQPSWAEKEEEKTSKTEPSEKPQKEEDAPEASVEDETDDESDGAKMPDYFHLQMDPIIISHLHKKYKKVTHFIVISYGIEIADQEALDKLKIWQMRLQDQILLNVSNYLGLFWRGRGDINQRQLIMLLKKLTAQVIPPEKINKIIINDLRVDKTK